MSKTNTKRYWTGEAPKRCDTCRSLITSAFSDVRTHSGQWGNLCDACLPHHTHTKRYGLGLGQRYEVQPDGKWLKTKG